MITIPRRHYETTSEYDIIDPKHQVRQVEGNEGALDIYQDLGLI